MSSNSVTYGEHAIHTNGTSSNNPFDDVPQTQPAVATLTAMAGMVIHPTSFTFSTYSLNGKTGDTAAFLKIPFASNNINK